MPTTREKLIDWLADLPDNTEIAIEDEDVVAMIGTKARFFTVGQFSDDAIQGNYEAFIGRRDDMVARLQQIHEEHAGQDTDEGAMIVTLEGYICGVPYLFTTDANEAFRFKNRAQAESFIAEFQDASLIGPQVLDRP